MSVLSSTPTWTWSADVLAFAEQEGVSSYLEPLRELVCRLFPTALSLRVYVQKDPEIRDLTFIIWEVHVPVADVPDFHGSTERWYREVYSICPAHLTGPFCFILLRDNP